MRPGQVSRYSISFGRPPMINPDYCDDPLTFCPELEEETASFRFQLQMYKVRGEPGTYKKQ